MSLLSHELEQPDVEDSIYSAEEQATNLALARSMRAKAKAGGLRFEVYLPPGLADWLLDMVETGRFHDPSEAVFVLMGVQKDLEPHHDLQTEILNRSLDAAMNDPRPSIPMDEFMAEMGRRMAKPRPKPARWPLTRRWRLDRLLADASELLGGLIPRRR